jgi:hypothetical protein
MKKLSDIIRTDGKNINECDGGVPGGLTTGDVAGMGDITFPGEDGEKGSGDIPLPSKTVYTQVMPYSLFVKKKKKKKFRKEDEPCVHSENSKIYDYVDDYRNYVDRTYDKIDGK